MSYERYESWTKGLIFLLILLIILLLASCKEDEVEPRECYRCERVRITSGFGDRSALGNHPPVEVDTTSDGWVECNLTAEDAKLLEKAGTSTVYAIIEGVNLKMETIVHCKLQNK